MKHRAKQWISLLLALSIVCGLIPAALAERLDVDVLQSEEPEQQSEQISEVSAADAGAVPDSADVPESVRALAGDVMAGRVEPTAVLSGSVSDTEDGAQTASDLSGSSLSVRGEAPEGMENQGWLSGLTYTYFTLKSKVKAPEGLYYFDPPSDSVTWFYFFCDPDTGVVYDWNQVRAHTLDLSFDTKSYTGGIFANYYLDSIFHGNEMYYDLSDQDTGTLRFRPTDTWLNGKGVFTIGVNGRGDAFCSEIAMISVEQNTGPYFITHPVSVKHGSFGTNYVFAVEVPEQYLNYLEWHCSRSWNYQMSNNNLIASGLGMPMLSVRKNSGEEYSCEFWCTINAPGREPVSSRVVKLHLAKNFGLYDEQFEDRYVPVGTPMTFSFRTSGTVTKREWYVFTKHSEYNGADNEQRYSWGVVAQHATYSIDGNTLTITPLDNWLNGKRVGCSVWGSENHHCQAKPSARIAIVPAGPVFGRTPEVQDLRLNVAYDFPVAAAMADSYSWDLVDSTMIPVPWSTVRQHASVSRENTSSLSVSFRDAVFSDYYYLRCTAVNSTGSSTFLYPLHFLIPPRITTTSGLPSGRAGGYYSTQLTASGSTPITWKLDPDHGTGLPDGLTLSSDGIISGYPTQDGTWAFRVRAVNAAGQDNCILSIGVGSKPAFAYGSLELKTAYVGVDYYELLEGYVSASGALWWELAPGSELPDGMVLYSGGAISGTPTSTGTYNIRLRVSNFMGTSEGTFRLKVETPTVQLSAQPTQITFGTLMEGYAYSEIVDSTPVTIRNDGPLPVRDLTYRITGSDAAVFSISQSGDSTILPTRQTKVHVRRGYFIPAGTYNAALEVCVDGSTILQVPLSFTVTVNPDFPTVENSLMFGSVEPTWLIRDYTGLAGDKSLARNILIRNLTDSQEVTVSVEGSGAQYFAVEFNGEEYFYDTQTGTPISFPMHLSYHGEYTCKVWPYQIPEGMTAEAVFNVTNGVCTISMPLTATAGEPYIYSGTLTPEESSLFLYTDYGSVDDTQFAFELTNTGTGTFDDINIEVTGEYFRKVLGIYSLAPGESAPIIIGMTSRLTTAGEYTAQVHVTNANGAFDETVTCRLVLSERELPANGCVRITGTGIHGQTLTASVEGMPEDANPIFRWWTTGGQLLARGPSCEVQPANIGELIYCTAEFVHYTGKLTSETIAARHDLGEPEFATFPTCTESGLLRRVCSVCGQTITERVPALGHRVRHVEAQAATCASYGNVEYWVCTRCNAYYLDEKCSRAADWDTVHTPVDPENHVGGVIDRDESSHWYACACGAHLEEENHIDQDSDGLCDVCCWEYTPTAPDLYDDISPYRTGNYTAPTRAGYVFAGWYEDAAFTTPIAQSVTEGPAYAKFVDAQVLAVKWQLSAQTNAQSAETKIRLVTTVDTLNFRKVGFRVDFGGIRQLDLTSKEVYRHVMGFQSGETTYYEPDVFSPESQYFMTAIISGVKNTHFDTNFTVVPYWVTLDGTTVDGLTKIFKVSDDWA